MNIEIDAFNEDGSEISLDRITKHIEGIFSNCELTNVEFRTRRKPDAHWELDAWIITNITAFSKTLRAAKSGSKCKIEGLVTGGMLCSNE
jgi:hypothetical protein